MSLKGKTLFVTGASRGIGLAIALRAARDGANIVVAAKTAEPHPKLPGTVYSAAEEIEKAGGSALPLLLDVRDAEQIEESVAAAAARFGGVDICINNASAISLTGTLDTAPGRFDLMHGINIRGTFLVSRACIPFLRKSDNPHVLALSPPLDLKPEWFGPHVVYTLSKFGMSMLMLGMAEEFREEGIAFNGLWPRTTIATSAIRYALGGDEAMRRCRLPDIMADAAYAIFNRPARQCTGNFYLDEKVLIEEGIENFEKYQVDPEVKPDIDLFTTWEDEDERITLRSGIAASSHNPTD